MSLESPQLREQEDLLASGMTLLKAHKLFELEEYIVWLNEQGWHDVAKQLDYKLSGVDYDEQYDNAKQSC